MLQDKLTNTLESRAGKDTKHRADHGHGGRKSESTLQDRLTNTLDSRGQITVTVEGNQMTDLRFTITQLDRWQGKPCRSDGTVERHAEQSKRTTRDRDRTMHRATV